VSALSLHIESTDSTINSFKYIQKNAKWEGPGSIQAGGVASVTSIIACIIYADVASVNLSLSLLHVT